MKVKEIKQGWTYHDGRHGMREVMSIDEREQTVRYKLLAARVERDLSAIQGPRSMLGLQSTVGLGSFAAWAKCGYSAEEGRKVLLQVQCARLKLSAGEKAVLTKAGQAANGDLKEGFVWAPERSEYRVMLSLERKGVVRRLDRGEVELTGLGAVKAVEGSGV